MVFRISRYILGYPGPLGEQKDIFDKDSWGASSEQVSEESKGRNCKMNAASCGGNGFHSRLLRIIANANLSKMNSRSFLSVIFADSLQPGLCFPNTLWLRTGVLAHLGLGPVPYGPKTTHFLGEFHGQDSYRKHDRNCHIIIYLVGLILVVPVVPVVFVVPVVPVVPIDSLLLSR